MGALFSAPGQAWPWLGILAAGALLASLSLPRGCAAHTWAALALVPLGVVGYALLLVPSFALVPPHGAAAVATAGVGGLLAWRLAVTRWRAAPRPRWSAAWLWVALTVLVALWVARAAARLGHAVAVGVPVPPLLGEPAAGDVALTALRSALIARHGIPPPSPLDPDYPLQYRYLFHALAASFAVHGAEDYARTTAAALGLVLAGIALAGAALASLRVRTSPVWPAAGCLAALYGPSYLLPDAARLAARGELSWFAIERVVAERWALSPLVPSFPSTFSSVESAPAIPAGALCWLAVLLVAAPLFDAPAPPRGWGVQSAVVGVALGALAFAADFFVPFALLGLVAALGVTRHWATSPRRSLPVAVGLMGGLGGTLAVLLLSARQLAPAGAATGLRLVWNDAIGTTATYGGNRALLAGGAPLPMPNWVYVHDWGVLFWPGLLAGLALAWRRRDRLLLCSLVAPLAAALFWHLFTVAYDAGLPTDLRVQMYRFASMATGAAAAPMLLAIVLAADSLRPHVRAAASLAVAAPFVAVGAGAGVLLTLGSAGLPRETAPQHRGEAALARRLASQPPGGRFALLGGPATFIGMYYGSPAGYMPVWWSIGGTAVPVGWDFGHPERYQATYRRVVEDLDPAAAAELGLTHVAAGPAALGPQHRERLHEFLARCGAVELARSNADERWHEQVLYRLSPAACGATG